MGRPRATDRPDTLEEIIRAAQGRFAERGYHATSLSDIAGAAGIKAPSLLYHFKSKEDLYDEIVRRTCRLVHERVDHALQEGRTARDKTLAILAAMYRLGMEQRVLFGMLIPELMHPHGVGRGVAIEELTPVMDRITYILTREADQPFPAAAPIRHVLMQILFAYAARASMGKAGAALWGASDETPALTAALLDTLEQWGRESTPQ